MKAKLYFPVVMFIMLYRVVLNKIFIAGHSNAIEQYFHTVSVAFKFVSSENIAPVLFGGQG